LAIDESGTSLSPQFGHSPPRYLLPNHPLPNHPRKLEPQRGPSNIDPQTHRPMKRKNPFFLMSLAVSQKMFGWPQARGATFSTTKAMTKIAHVASKKHTASTIASSDPLFVIEIYKKS
jgi:hypothetical protein